MPQMRIELMFSRPQRDVLTTGRLGPSTCAENNNMNFCASYFRVQTAIIVNCEELSGYVDQVNVSLSVLMFIFARMLLFTSQKEE